jgi:hypothetical protein
LFFFCFFFFPSLNKNLGRVHRDALSVKFGRSLIVAGLNLRVALVFQSGICGCSAGGRASAFDSVSAASSEMLRLQQVALFWALQSLLLLLLPLLLLLLLAVVLLPAGFCGAAASSDFADGSGTNSPKLAWAPEKKSKQSAFHHDEHPPPSCCV